MNPVHTTVASTYFGLSLEAWIGMAIAVIAFFGVAGWSLVRTLRQEDRKANLIERQGHIETYSPKALADLRNWIENNPDDPYVEDARQRYNECVELLKEHPQQFYDWSEQEIASLERLSP